MLYQVMNEINNHFIRSIERKNFSVESDGVVGNFSETYLAGMYIIIEGSILNDGLYEVESVTNSKITTVEKDLKPEDTSEQFVLFGSNPPSSFVSLVTEISNHNESIGVSSESIDDYSVSYGNGGGEWEVAFKNKLQAYRRVFDDLDVNITYTPNCTDRWC